MRIRDSHPRLAFAVSWYSSREGKPLVDHLLALPDVAFAKQLLADTLIDTQ
jgi:hypothetical protein